MERKVVKMMKNAALIWQLPALIYTGEILPALKIEGHLNSRE